MKKPRRSLILFLVWFIFVSHQILPVVCETGQYIAEEEEKSSFHHVVSRTISSLKKTHQASWEKLKTIIHGVQMKFTPPPPPTPTLEAPGSVVSENGGDKIKEAAKTSVSGVSESGGDKIKEAAKTSVSGVSESGGDKIKETAKTSGGDKMKEAAKTSVETSQATVDGAAKAAAAAGVHQTADKIKKSVPDNKEGSRNEL